MKLHTKIMNLAITLVTSQCIIASLKTKTTRDKEKETGKEQGGKKKKNRKKKFA